MRQLIKNTVHSITYTMGLPLHRIAFAWTGDRSEHSGVRDLNPQPPPGTDPHMLIKEPRAIYNALPDIPRASPFFFASCDEATSPDPWPRGHSLLLGPTHGPTGTGVSDLINGPQILNYLRLLMRHFQTCVPQKPSSLCSPAPPEDTRDPCDRNQQCGTERLDRYLDILIDKGAHRPRPE